MVNKLLKIILVILSFLASGWTVGFVFQFDILLLITPPLYFVITYLILLHFVLRQNQFGIDQFAECVCIFFSFYFGLVSPVPFDINKYSTEHPHLFSSLVQSIVGGGIIQLYLWRKIKKWWKYFLIPANTLFAGWVFSLFWSYKSHGFAYYLELDGYRYHDSFCPWFVIVGSTTVIMKLLFDPTHSPPPDQSSSK
jgi:hypothetical protein